MDLYLLVVYRMIFPKATADEIRRYILENNPTNANLYSRVDISRAETRIKMTRKRGATTANQAFTPLNMLKHEF